MIPNMVTTLHGFEESMVFQVVQKTVVDHDVVEGPLVRPTLYFEGVIQPLHSRELLVKPEGERKFKWWTLFTDMQLTVDSVVKDSSNTVFRVMSSSDWNEAGYYQYQLTEGPGTDGGQ